MLLKSRRLKHNVPLLVSGEFLGNFCFYSPLMVIYCQQVAGSYALAMSVFSAAALTIAFADVPTGFLSDRYGRRAVAIAGAVLDFIAVLCLSLANSYLFLLAYAVLHGLSTALFSGNNEALMYETLGHDGEQDKFGRMMGRFHGGAQLARAMTGVIALVMLKMGLSLKALVIFSLVPLAITVGIFLFLLEPPHTRNLADAHPLRHMKDAFVTIMQKPKLMMLGIAGALRFGIGDSAHYIMPGFIASVWPLWLAGSYRTLQHAIGVAGFLFADKLTRKVGALRVLSVGTLISGGLDLVGCMLANAFSPILMAMTQLSWASSYIARSIVQQHEYTDSQRATMGSFMSFVENVVGAICLLGIGILADHIGIVPAIAFYSVLFIIPAFIYYRIGATNYSS